MTLEELGAIPLQYTFGYSADTHAVRQYVNVEHKLAKQVYTPRNPKTGMWGNGEISYKLTDSDEEFDNLEDLLTAINARESA